MSDAIERIREKLDRIPDSDAVTLDKSDVRTLLGAVVWEYAYRDDSGHVWPYSERDDEEGTTLTDIEEMSKEDWWQYETEGSTLHRRIKASEPGPWEPIQQIRPEEAQQ